MTAEFDYHFAAPIETLDFGRMAYSVIYLPDDLVDALPLGEYPRLRIEGEVGGVSFKGAIQPVGAGAYYLLLSKALLKSASLALGETASAWFNIADQNAVDVPPELQFVLDIDDEAREIWERLTPGRQRGLAHRVASAKRVETREARAEVIHAELREMIGDV